MKFRSKIRGIALHNDQLGLRWTDRHRLAARRQTRIRCSYLGQMGCASTLLWSPHLGPKDSALAADFADNPLRIHVFKTFQRLEAIEKGPRAREGVLIDSLFEGLADEFGHADACTARLQFEAPAQIILPI